MARSTVPNPNVPNPNADLLKIVVEAHRHFGALKALLDVTRVAATTDNDELHEGAIFDALSHALALVDGLRGNVDVLWDGCQRLSKTTQIAASPAFEPEIAASEAFEPKITVKN